MACIMHSFLNAIIFAARNLSPIKNIEEKWGYHLH